LFLCLIQFQVKPLFERLSPSIMTDNTLLSLYADAQSILTRIEERRRLSPVRRVWKTRCLIAERQALAWMDSIAIDPNTFMVDGRGHVIDNDFDLTHWRRAVGAEISLEMLQTDSAAVLAWLGVDDLPMSATANPWAVTISSLDDIRQRVDAWQQQVTDMRPCPPLLHSARLARSWWRASPIGRGDAVASFLIGDRFGPGRWDCSYGGLVALGFQRQGTAWKLADQPQFDRLWLQAIASGGRDHLDQEMRLRVYAARAAGHIASRRRPGRLKEVILMAMSRPYITSRLVADHLSLSSAGAIKLLGIAIDLGLLLERSGQSSYRSYAIPVGNMLASSSSPSPIASLKMSNFWEDDENGASPEAS
jgi:hypothetical protein